MKLNSSPKVLVGSSAGPCAVTSLKRPAIDLIFNAAVVAVVSEESGLPGGRAVCRTMADGRVRMRLDYVNDVARLI